MMLELELPDAVAWALAEFLKRAGYSHFRALAATEQEAWEMQVAGEMVAKALAEQGIAPR